MIFSGIIETLCKADISAWVVRRFFCFSLVLYSFPGETIPFLTAGMGAVADNKVVNTEYQLKATFLYNFMKFVEWPDLNSTTKQEEPATQKLPVILGIMGENYLKNNLNFLTEKTIKKRPIKIVIIEGFEAYKKKNSTATIEAYFADNKKTIESCHLLFISTSEEDRLAEINKFTDKLPILTVSDILNFADAGGVVGFVMENNKIRFDINTISAETKHLKMSSQLLQLARKIHKKQPIKQE